MQLLAQNRKHRLIIYEVINKINHIFFSNFGVKNGKRFVYLFG